MNPPLHRAVLATLVSGCLALPSFAEEFAARTPLAGVEGEDLLAQAGDESGLRAGPFELRGVAAVSLGFDSNPYADSTAGDSQLLSKAQLLVRADNRAGSRAFAALGFVNARRYQDADDQDSTEFGAGGNYHARLSTRDEISLRLSGQRRFEPRGEIETPTYIAVSLYEDLRAGARYTHTFNRLSLSTSADARRLQYAAQSQEFRDHSVYRGELRGSYDLRGDVAWFASAYFNRDEFDDASPFVASADTLGALLGVQLSLRDFFDLELGAGYFERRFDANLDALGGVAVRGALSFRPTRLTQLRVELTRSDEPTQLAGAFGKIRNEMSLRLAHDYSRNLQLHLGARVTLDEFDSITRKDTLYLAEFGAGYLVSRHSIIRLSYDYGSRQLDALDRGHVRHEASLSFIGTL